MEMNIPEEFKELYDRVTKKEIVKLTELEAMQVVDFALALPDDDVVTFLKSIHPPTLSLHIVPLENQKIDDLCKRFVTIMKGKEKYARDNFVDSLVGLTIKEKIQRLYEQDSKVLAKIFSENSELVNTVKEHFAQQGATSHAEIMIQSCLPS